MIVMVKFQQFIIQVLASRKMKTFIEWFLGTYRLPAKYSRACRDDRRAEADKGGEMSKYHAQKTTVDGIIFASKAEATRYSVLKMLQSNGDISALELQPKFPVVVNGKKICTYISDFRYFDNWTNTVIIEDVKSTFTRKIAVYRLKVKLVEALYGIEITET